ncbi:MAG: 16S rRNA (cytidine(1402)-2'-O)-methyltransferase [Verrucomicrobiales bacterium]
MREDRSSPQDPGILRIVATPIGNLGDITLRALDALRSADIIACEDTRHTARLLTRHEIRGARRVSLHEHNEARRSEELVAELLAGRSVALVSDAGMPTISDPGQRLLQRCIAAEIPYEVLPGASAVITALAGSGLSTETFTYRGFLPTKKGARARELHAATEREDTTIFFESPHRIAATLEMLAAIEPDRLLCVARELTKKFEEYRRERACVLRDHFQARSPKGEFVLLVSGTKMPKWIHQPPGAEAVS